MNSAFCKVIKKIFLNSKTVDFFKEICYTCKKIPKRLPKQVRKDEERLLTDENDTCG